MMGRRKFNFTDDLKGLQNAWLSPTGKWVRSGFSCHVETAQEIIEDYLRLGRAWDVAKKDGCDHPSEYLEKHRWIRLETLPTTTRFILTSPWQTKKQQEAIDEWCSINGYHHVQVLENCF